MEADTAQLWEKYYIVSSEMLKFIERDEVDMFLQLLEQRSVIQEMLEKRDDRVWTKTEAGQQLYQKLKPIDMQVQYKVRVWLNKTKQKNQAAKFYDMLGAQPAGNIFNQKF